MEMSTHTMIRIMLEHSEAVDIYNAIGEVDTSKLDPEERDALNAFCTMLEFYI